MATSKKLPNHLASLLKHGARAASDEVAKPQTEISPRPSDADANVAGDAAASGMARRRKVAKQRRKAREAEERHAAAEEKRAARELAAQAAAAAAAAREAANASAPTEQEPPQKAVKKLKRKAGLKKRRLECTNEAAEADGGTGLGDTFDSEGAERDAAIIRHMEQRLGIGGSDAKKRKRFERAIFDDLGFNDDLQGVPEEPPSSGEEGTGANVDDDAAFSDLLNGILGGGLR